MIPGEYLLASGDIEANVGRRTLELTVENTGDRPIQVGSHFHFFEVNRALRFDRAQAFGMRLNVAAGTAVRFQPGDAKRVTLLELAGAPPGRRPEAPPPPGPQGPHPPPPHPRVRAPNTQGTA